MVNIVLLKVSLGKKMHFRKRSWGERKSTVPIETDLFEHYPIVVAKNGLMNIKIQVKIETSHLLIN